MLAENAPGFFKTPEELDDAVAIRLNDVANIGSSAKVISKAPMFCKKSPASALSIKNGGTVINRRIMLALSSEPDQIGVFVA